MAKSTPPAENLDLYSASSTLIPFEHPVPLLRGPVPTGPSNDPSAGPFVLAFRDPQSWASAYQACESQILQQCETGARIGCSIAASNRCKPPWWKTLVGAKQDLAERAECEEAEMAICFESAKEKCRGLAAEKCSGVFKDARIAISDRNPKVVWKEISKFLSLLVLSNKGFGFHILKPERPWIELKSQLAATNYKGSELLGPDTSIKDFLKQSSCKKEV